MEEVEKGKLVGVMMTDQSSAYEMVSFPIMRSKLKLFGLDEDSLNWLDSFLRGRKQSFYVDGHLSEPRDLDQGLPQGSNLAPLLYILYCSNIPDLPHIHPVSVVSPSTYCEECGSTVSYMDDNTYSVACNTPEQLTDRLTEEYNRIADYMACNELCLNDDKTHLLVL